MAVSTTNAVSGPYEANGVTTAFPFTFTAPSASEVVVITRDSDGTDTEVNPSAYLVTLVASGGGTVTFETAPASGLDVIIYLDASFTQEIEFENGAAWLAEPVNEGYDRSASRDQVLKRDINRGFLVPIGEAPARLPGVSARAGKFAAFDAEGNMVPAEGLGSDADLREDLADDTAGATLVSFKPAGAGAVARSLRSKARDHVSVKDFGAVGDGATDDTTAIQAAIDYVCLAGGSLFFPAGTYAITSTLTVDTGVYDTGVMLYGMGRNTVISQTGVGLDAIRWSSTQILQSGGIRDMHIKCSATAGHCINIAYGIANNIFDNVNLTQLNPAKRVIYGDFSALTGDVGIYTSKFRGGTWKCAPTSTVSGVLIKVQGTNFNENIFENLVCYHSNTEQFFKIEAVAGASYWMINNLWKTITFEICKGGGIYFQCFKNCRFEGLSFWDSQGDYTDNLIESAAGSGIESIANTFTNCGRNGDELASGICDIYTPSGQDFTYADCYTQTGDSPRYDFGGKRGTIIGKLFGTLVNHSAMVILNAIDGLRFPATVNGISLNYYDEGTWTGTLGGSTTDPTVPVTATGRWTRVGRTVRVDIAFADVATTGATGVVQIRGLPFAAGAGATQMGLVALQGIGANAAVGALTAVSTTVNLVQQAALSTNVTYGAGTGQFVYLSMEYTV